MKNALDARRFEDLSKRDNLTGLYNDRYFYERLEMETQRASDEGSDLSLIFFDLDHFKEVNDTHGHLVGSQVLKEVAIIVEEVFLDSGAASARYGGDEFVILMPDAHWGKVITMVRRCGRPSKGMFSSGKGFPGRAVPEYRRGDYLQCGDRFLRDEGGERLEENESGSHPRGRHRHVPRKRPREKPGLPRSRQNLGKLR